LLNQKKLVFLLWYVTIISYFTGYINYPQMLLENKISGNGQAQGPVPTQLSFSGIYKIEIGHYFF